LWVLVFNVYAYFRQNPLCCNWHALNNSPCKLLTKTTEEMTIQVVLKYALTLHQQKIRTFRDPPFKESLKAVRKFDILIAI